MLPASLLPHSSTLIVRDREMQRERVATVGGAQEHDRSISKSLLHSEDVSVEVDRPIMVGDEEVNVTDPDRCHPVQLPPLAAATRLRRARRSHHALSVSQIAG